MFERSFQPVRRIDLCCRSLNCWVTSTSRRYPDRLTVANFRIGVCSGKFRAAAGFRTIYTRRRPSTKVDRGIWVLYWLCYTGIRSFRRVSYLIRFARKRHVTRDGTAALKEPTVHIPIFYTFPFVARKIFRKLCANFMNKTRFKYRLKYK